MIYINIVDNEGHNQVECSNEKEALDFIKREIETGERWVYFDSNSVDIDLLNEEAIKKANTITMTNPLVGGSNV